MRQDFGLLKFITVLLDACSNILNHYEESTQCKPSEVLRRVRAGKRPVSTLAYHSVQTPHNAGVPK